MILPAQAIRSSRPIEPFCERTVVAGMSFGLGPAGYDVRVAESGWIDTGQFLLASTFERFEMPNDLLGYVKDKSTWARRGLCVQNTVIEPGWRGYLTLELTNHGRTAIQLQSGWPIAQIVFHRLEQPTEAAYDGKYQDQAQGAQVARFEK